MTAILLGATGATGKELLYLLLENPIFDIVKILVRRPINLAHPKLRVEIINFDHPDEWGSMLSGDVVFSCLGTTLKDAGSQAKQWIVDYDYPLAIAKKAKEQGIPSFVLVSAANANSRSLFFYSKMKGQLDESIQQLNFKKTIILRPPLLERPNTNRKAESILVKLINKLNTFGILKSQKTLSTNNLAQALINSYLALEDGQHILNPDSIRRIISNKKN